MNNQIFGMILIGCSMAACSVKEPPRMTESQTCQQDTTDCFFGLPLSISRAALEDSHRVFSFNEQEFSSTGIWIGQAELDRGVKAELVFNENGYLSYAETRSDVAKFSDGIGIGSNFAEVREAWPNGRLLYGFEENTAFVIYLTGTNIVFGFDETEVNAWQANREIGKINIIDTTKLKVERIRALPIPAPVPETCRPGYCL